MPHDRFYGIAAEEIARHEVDKDLMARAYAMALGDAEKTKAIYIGVRAERLEELACELVEEHQRAEEARQREEQRQAREASEARQEEAKENYRKEREASSQRPAASGSPAFPASTSSASSKPEEWQGSFRSRKEYHNSLRIEFGFLNGIEFAESSVSSDHFAGAKERLVAPAKLADVAEALGCMEFKLIDAVKAGSVSGVRDQNDDWWISSKRFAAPS